MLSKLSHSIISPSWLLSRQSATLNITPVPWMNTKSEREEAWTQMCFYEKIVLFKTAWMCLLNICVCTENTWHKAEWELWGKEREEPRGCVKAWADLVILEVIVQLAVIVVEQSGELVHLNLGRQGECANALWLQSSLTPSRCFTCHTDSRQKEKYKLSVTLKLGRYRPFNFQ